jgi:hypothetical protein
VSEERVADEGGRPVLRIVSGNPTPEELAALTALVSAVGGEPAAEPLAPVRGRWNDPARNLRAALLLTGPGAWRSIQQGWRNQ